MCDSASVVVRTCESRSPLGATRPQSQSNQPIALGLLWLSDRVLCHDGPRPVVDLRYLGLRDRLDPFRSLSPNLSQRTNPRRPAASGSIRELDPDVHSVHQRPSAPSTSVRPQIWRQSRPNRAASRTLWSSTRARPPAATVRQRTPLSAFFKVPDCPLPHAFASPRSLHHHRAHRDRRPQGRARHLDDDRLGRQGQRRQPASRGPRGGAR